MRRTFSNSALLDALAGVRIIKSVVVGKMTAIVSPEIFDFLLTMPTRAEEEKLKSQADTCVWSIVNSADNFLPGCSEYMLYKQAYRHCPNCGGRIITSKPTNANNDKESDRSPSLEDFNQKIQSLVVELRYRGVEPKYLFVGELTWQEMKLALLDVGIHIGPATLYKDGLADKQWAGLDVHIVRTDHLLVVH